MNTSLLPRTYTRLAAAAGMVLACASAGATPLSWDAAADYSTTKTTGVDGVWSYGSTGQTLAGVFKPFTGSSTKNSTYFYWHSSNSFDLQIAKMLNGAYNVGSMHIASGMLNMHPSASGEYSVLRFTAPTTGEYNLATSFWGNDANPTTSDFHVRTDGNDIFSGVVNQFGTDKAQSWNGLLHLNAGDTLDFAVGFGTNKNYYFDSTGISAVVTMVPQAVPEPSSAVIMISGAVLLTMARRRRSRVQ